MHWRSGWFRNLWVVGPGNGMFSDDLQAHPISGQWSDILPGEDRLLSAVPPAQSARKITEELTQVFHFGAMSDLFTTLMQMGPEKLVLAVRLDKPFTLSVLSDNSQSINLLR